MISLFSTIVPVVYSRIPWLSWLWQETSKSSGVPVWALLLVLQVINIPVYMVLLKTFFSDMEGFMESIMYWFTPDILSMFRGEAMDDFFAELKLIIFLGLIIGLCAIEFRLVIQYIIPLF